MNIGIVGPEEKKFTKESRESCKEMIRFIFKQIISLTGIEKHCVVSGHCPLGGVDIYAEEIAKEFDFDMDIKAPRQLTWDAEYGYKQRNLDIAKSSDVLYVFVLDRLPDGFDGMKFDYCYHCGSKEHVKGGGCWTGKQAKKLGKNVIWMMVKQ